MPIGDNWYHGQGPGPALGYLGPADQEDYRSRVYLLRE